MSSVDEPPIWSSYHAAAWWADVMRRNAWPCLLAYFGTGGTAKRDSLSQRLCVPAGNIGRAGALQWL
jgi:hypothetical protein